MSANAATRLLQHYVDNFRRLPWRSPPGMPPPEPYRVWLSEIMLQQTTVAAVVPRFTRFVERWPTVEALAAAPEQDVLQEWAGLGYYARARNLVACAREVTRYGGFPHTEAGLRQLPGIGPYTAAAIAAIAFGAEATPIDTNVERVVARLEALDGKAAVRSAAEMMTPPGRAGDFAQAMMDLGASICRPKAPLCGQCPLAADCRAFMQGAPEAYPAPRGRKVRPHKHAIAWWTERDGCVWLVRRPANGLLGGMAALPGLDWQEEPLPVAPIARVRHMFSHFTLDLAVMAAPEPSGEGWWQPLDLLADAGLPTLYRRAAEAVLAARTALAA